MRAETGGNLSIYEFPKGFGTTLIVILKHRVQNRLRNQITI